ncbi:MAG TPA: hypothetical protein VK509_20110, partial [Polyangiales bacterium]|nr:hypothetical protein [Polyangiales bacterium]
MLGCRSATFDAANGNALWKAGALELIDGTTRHVVSLANDGERLYQLVHGISSYRFEASSLQTGERLWSRELGPSQGGQDGSDGAIYLATGTGVFALDADTAELRWERRDLPRLRTPRLALSP